MKNQKFEAPNKLPPSKRPKNPPGHRIYWVSPKQIEMASLMATATKRRKGEML